MNHKQRAPKTQSSQGVARADLQGLDLAGRIDAVQRAACGRLDPVYPPDVMVCFHPSKTQLGCIVAEVWWQGTFSFTSEDRGDTLDPAEALVYLYDVMFPPCMVVGTGR